MEFKFVVSAIKLLGNDYIFVEIFHQIKIL
jgi:hypothetical protein